MCTAEVATDRVLCHCLGITESEVHSALVTGAAGCLRSVMRQTGAGTGCTACHCAIKELLAAQRADGAFLAGSR